MRFILGLCVVAGCTLCGSAMAGAQRRRVRLLESVINGLRLLKLHTVSMFEPLPQALGATGCAVLEGVGSQMTPGASAAQAWEGFKKREGRRGGGIDALSPEDVRALDEMGLRKVIVGKAFYEGRITLSDIALWSQNA